MSVAHESCVTITHADTPAWSIATKILIDNLVCSPHVKWVRRSIVYAHERRTPWICGSIVSQSKESSSRFIDGIVSRTARSLSVWARDPQPRTGTTVRYACRCQCPRISFEKVHQIHALHPAKSSQAHTGRPQGGLEQLVDNLYV